MKLHEITKDDDDKDLKGMMAKHKSTYLEDLAETILSSNNWINDSEDETKQMLKQMMADHGYHGDDEGDLQLTFQEEGDDGYAEWEMSLSSTEKNDKHVVVWFTHLDEEGSELYHVGRDFPITKSYKADAKEIMDAYHEMKKKEA